MSRKLNLREATGLVAALAIAGLAGPASAQEPVRYFSPECAQYFKDVYCPANWQEENFTSSSACAEHYKDLCWWTYHY